MCMLPLTTTLVASEAMATSRQVQTTSMASDINFDLGFEISNLYYPGNHVHVALTTLVASEAMTTSK